MANRAITDDFTTDPWWWEAARPRSSEDAALPDSTDVLVVGAGYTGLSAALTLAQAGREVLVLDRLMPGEAASSRNAGFVGRSLLGGFSQMAEKLGLAETVTLHRGAEEAYDFVVDLMKRLSIACHLVHRGRVLPVWNQAQYDETAADFERQRQHLRIEGGMLSEQELSQELRISGARGALLIENTSSVHPGMYHAGLRRAVEAAGARVAGNCAVTRLARQAGGFDVHTERGTLRTNEVVVATNAYTGGLTPWIRRRLVRSTTTLAACEPRDPALLKSLLPGDRTYVDYSRYQFNYWRIAPDSPSRLLLGGQTGLLFKRPEEIALRLQADLERIFPELAGTRFSISGVETWPSPWIASRTWVRTRACTSRSAATERGSRWAPGSGTRSPSSFSATRAAPRPTTVAGSPSPQASSVFRGSCRSSRPGHAGRTGAAPPPRGTEPQATGTGSTPPLGWFLSALDRASGAYSRTSCSGRLQSRARATTRSTSSFSISRWSTSRRAAASMAAP